jgi:ABC-type branched-subunit amino acid transport system permease subunit
MSPIGGVLTGLVYGLMALGLSVIFGVVRVVNFAHGEMMSIAMYHRGRAVLQLAPRSADHAGADRGGDVRVRLRALQAWPDQSLHHPAGAYASSCWWWRWRSSSSMYCS